jgi:outer membrane protein TolC
MRNLKIYIIALMVSSFSYGQTLESLIAEGLKNSPEIQEIQSTYKGIQERKNEVNTLPNTNFGLGYFLSEPETRTGAQRLKLSVSQMMPWFGSITTRQNYVTSIAEAKFVDIAIASRKLITSISQSYYQLYSNQEKRKILSKNIELLKTYETMALTAVETGKASAVDVLKLQIRQNDLEKLVKILEQQYASEETRMNRFLNREKDETIALVQELNMPKTIPSVDKSKMVIHPELIKYDKLYQSVEQSELLNQKEQMPMIGFGLDYVAVAERPGMSFSDNGKDIIMPMFSVSIPIFNKKYRSKTKQNDLQKEALVFGKESRKNALITKLETALNNRISSKINFDTQVQNLEKANNAEQILIKSYESGTLNFNDVLDIQELQLKFQMEKIEAIKSFFIQSTIIHYLSNKPW